MSERQPRDVWAVFDSAGLTWISCLGFDKSNAIDKAWRLNAPRITKPTKDGYRHVPDDRDNWWRRMKRKGWSVKRAKIVAMEGENG